VCNDVSWQMLRATSEDATQLQKRVQNAFDDVLSNIRQSLPLGPIFNMAYVDLKGCLTSETQLLLRKGRRLTQQTLDSCQLRRVVGGLLRTNT